jgi:peptidoglycan hydrolase CwlO-like protein
VAVLSDAQAKDIKATTAEVARLKTEIASLRELIERRTSELQSGVPAIRKTGG